MLKAWQAFTVTDNTAFYLPRRFAQARFEFRDKALSGLSEEPVRWKRAVHAVSGADCSGDRVDCFGNIGFGVGQLYTAHYFPPAAKAKIEALVADIKAAMRARLERLDWMGPATKVEALKKLDTYQIKVGYPDHPRDYSALVIHADDLVGNVRRAGEGDWQFLFVALQRTGRSQRLVDDTADQRCLQRFAAGHRFPSRHSAAAAIRPGSGPGGQLRGYRRRDRPRDDARIR